MTVTVLSGRLDAVGDGGQDLNQFAPVRSVIRIGNAIVCNVYVLPEAEALLVPGRRMVLHIVGDSPKVLFAIETADGRLHDFTATVLRRSREKKGWAVVLILFSMLLTGLTLVGVVVWPLFLALLVGALHLHFVPSQEEMQHHLLKVGKLYRCEGELAAVE